MSITSDIRGLLKDKYIIEKREDSITITEKDVMEVRIDRITMEAIGIGLGKGSHISSLIREGEHHDSICDQILFIHDKEKDAFWAVFCELKKSANGIVKGCRQLSCTRPLLDYIRRMIEVHCEKRFTFVERYVLIVGNEEMAKQRVQQGDEVMKFHDIKVRILYQADTIPVRALLR